MKFRPIQESDYSYFRIPPLPRGATGWVLEDPYPVGFTAFDLVPGLPHICDLYLFVLPSYRGAGYGGTLLEHCCAKARAQQVKQISTPLEDLHSPFAKFLRKHGFFAEHAEIELAYALPKRLPAPDVTLVQYSAEKSTPLLRKLYDDSFRHTAWYQPYDSDEEIINSLRQDSEGYFLLHETGVVGFALVKFEGDSVEIEPFGIIESKQRKGYGRILMQGLLYQLVQRDITEARLTVWEQNLPALLLYESFGFQGVSSRTFLAKDL